MSADETELRGPQLGLRERKKRALRRRLSETATAMFLQHGFDQVRVSDIADACDVSAKTLYNYFPTKESLLFDRGEALASCLQGTIDEPHDVLDAVASLIRDDLDALLEAAGPSATAAESEGIRTVMSFATLVASKSSLRGAVSEQADRLTQLAARALAASNDTSIDAPENQIAGSALVSLWQIELRGLVRAANTTRPLTDVYAEVSNEIERGVELVRRLAS